MTDRRLASCALLVVILASGCAAPGAEKRTAEVVILSISDWHGQLDPIGGVGGAAVLSAYFARERQAHPSTLTFTAGDVTGATPPLSAFFDDEPAIRAMGLMGFDATTLGNHDFDAGVERARDHTERAQFTFLAANLEGAADALPRVEPWRIFEAGGVKVGVVGLVNEEAPTITKPGSFGDMRITDSVAAALAARNAMRAAGAQALVILTHKGVDREGKGALVDLARNVTGFDLIIGDHTNAPFEARINGALVIEDPSKGVRYARTTLVVDRGAARVTSATVEFVVPEAAGIEPDARIAEMLAPYRAQIAPKLDERIAVAPEAIPHARGNGTARDSPMGSLVADAMREAARAQIALRNPGGTRAGLPTSYAPLDPTVKRDAPPYDLVRGDAYVVLPFGNALVSGDVTGRTIWAAIEHGLGGDRPPDVSGMRVVYDSTRPAGSRAVSITLDGDPLPCPVPALPCDAAPRGAPILPDDTRYSIVVGDYVALGGDGYDMFTGLGASGALEADVLIEHLERLGTIEPRVDGRMWDAARVREAS